MKRKPIPKYRNVKSPRWRRRRNKEYNRRLTPVAQDYLQFFGKLHVQHDEDMRGAKILEQAQL